MRRLTFILLIMLLPILTGCRAKQVTIQDDGTEYCSNISAEDCYLCGSGMESLAFSDWGQNNIALISLNTFEVRPIEINRYDRLGQPIEEYSGVLSSGHVGSTEDGYSARLMLDYDRGYAVASVDFQNDETLDISKAASFLCTNCLNDVLSQKISRYFGVGVINLDTKEIRLFEKNLTGFGLGDFYINCDLKRNQNDNSRQMKVLIFYCPIRYPESP